MRIAMAVTIAINIYYMKRRRVCKCVACYILSEYRPIDKKFILITLGSFHDPTSSSIFSNALFI